MACKKAGMLCTNICHSCPGECNNGALVDDETDGEDNAEVRTSSTNNSKQQQTIITTLEEAPIKKAKLKKVISLN